MGSDNQVVISHENKEVLRKIKYVVGALELLAKNDKAETELDDVLTAVCVILEQRIKLSLLQLKKTADMLEQVDTNTTKH
jgi:hypothetical protein